MKFIVNSKDLLSGVLSVVKALPVRTTMPILEGIYCEAGPEGLRLMCSDLMLQKEYRIPEAEVEEFGKAILPGKLFTEIVRKLPEGDAQVILNAKTVDVACGRAKSNIQCIEYDDFPEMKFDKQTYAVALPPTDWRSMINETVFAVSQDESKPILTGVLLELGEKATIVATDSYQFAMRSTVLSTPVEERAVVVPGKTMLEIGRMMEETQEKEATLQFSPTHVTCRVNRSCLTARLLDGDYIKYKQILPKDFVTRVLIDKDELIESIDRAQLMAREGNNNIVMQFHDNKLNIVANSYVGRINEELMAQINGEDIDIAFNPKFCINILKCIPAEKIYMEFTTSIAPCVVKPAVGDGYYYLIVPVRIYSQF